MRSFPLFHLAATSSLLSVLLLSSVFVFAERSTEDKAPQIVLSQHIGLNNKVFLSWEANTRLTPKYWVVERAKINGSFQAISRLKVDEPLVFVDESPWPSARYRVKAVWADGQQKISNHVAWRSLSLYFPLEVSATTEKDQLIFSFPKTREELKLSIYNAEGKKISMEQVAPYNQELILNTQAFPEGAYILEAQYQGEAYRTRWYKH